MTEGAASESGYVTSKSPATQRKQGRPWSRFPVSNSVVRYGAASAVARASSILTVLILTPLAIDRLGVTGYGIWVLALTVPNFVASPDLGISQGLVNRLAETHLRRGNLSAHFGDLHDLTRLLAALALLWFVLGIVAITWYIAAFSEGSQLPPRQTFIALVLALGVFVLGIPATMWGRAQLAQERGHESVIWEAAGRVGVFFASLLVLLFWANVVLLVVASLLPMTVAAWLNMLWYSKREFAGYSPPSRSSLRVTYAQNRAVINDGRQFFVLQIIWLVTVGMDVFIINAIAGSTSAAYFAVARRPFDLIPLVVGLFAAALWPVFHRLHARGEHVRVLSAVIWLSVSSAAIALIASALLVARSGPVYQYLGAGQIAVEAADLYWLGLQTIATVVALVLANYLNSIEGVRTRARLALATAAPILVAKVTSLEAGDIHTFIRSSGLISMFIITGPLLVLSAVGYRKRLASGGDPRVPQMDMQSASGPGQRPDRRASADPW